MSHRTLIAAALALASLFVLPASTRLALAADLDGGYAAPQPVAEQKVEFGTGWYIRGDLGVNQAYSVYADQLPDSNEFLAGINHTHNAGYDASIGGGYALTNGFRGDITADFHQPSSSENDDAFCYESFSQSCISKGHFKPYDALINGYYDFGSWGILSPYVGAGVGVAFGELSSSLTGGTNGYGGAIGYHQLAWALMAGISLDVYDHTKLDVGYRYVDNGSVSGTHLYYHEIRAGIRYMIDN